MTAIARTHVWHKDKCFLVSTINRASSAVAAYGAEYAETMVWEWDTATGSCGKLIGQAEACHNGIHKHQRIVEQLHSCGDMERGNE